PAISQGRGDSGSVIRVIDAFRAMAAEVQHRVAERPYLLDQEGLQLEPAMVRGNGNGLFRHRFRFSKTAIVDGWRRNAFGYHICGQGAKSLQQRPKNGYFCAFDRRYSSFCTAARESWSRLIKGEPTMDTSSPVLGSTA